jgi:hypothetical protein
LRPQLIEENQLTIRDSALLGPLKETKSAYEGQAQQDVLEHEKVIVPLRVKQSQELAFVYAYLDQINRLRLERAFARTLYEVARIRQQPS